MTLIFDSEHLLHEAPSPVQPSNTPFWFKAGAHWCSAFLHSAEATRWSHGDTCAVLCPSIALEQLRGARHQRALARKLAASGVTTLRFSFQGTDNGSGHVTLDGDASSLVPSWRAAVLRAIEIARTRSHCSRVVLVARRLGALIALSALRDANSELLEGVELVLWDPASSGKNFLRDLRIRERLRATTTPEAATVEDPNSPIVAVEQTFEFSRATVDDIAKLELNGQLPLRLRTHVVTARLDRASRAAVDAWHLDFTHMHVAADAAFDFDQLEGPELPGYTFNAIGDIAGDNKRRAQGNRLSPMLYDALTSATALGDDLKDCSEQLELPTLQLQEKWVCVNDATSLNGLITVPHGLLPDDNRRADSSDVKKVVVMLNMGVLGTPGEGDANMLLARRVAKGGIPVLRLDFRGTGESPSQSPLSDNRAYVRGHTKDVANAVQFVRKHFPKAIVIVQGICSGAYWAIHAAAQLVGIDRVIAVNPQLYAGSRLPTNLESMRAVESSLEVGAAVTDASKWRKLLTGQYSIPALFNVARGLTLRVRDVVLPGTRHTNVLPGVPALDLETLFPHGPYFDLVFSKADLGYHFLMQHGPTRIRGLSATRDLRLHTIKDADHTFSTPPQRAQLDRVIAQLLGLQFGRLK